MTETRTRRPKCLQPGVDKANDIGAALYCRGTTRQDVPRPLPFGSVEIVVVHDCGVAVADRQYMHRSSIRGPELAVNVE